MLKVVVAAVVAMVAALMSWAVGERYRNLNGLAEIVGAAAAMYYFEYLKREVAVENFLHSQQTG